MYHSKKIGIFISHIYSSFQRSLCQGIIDKAAEFGYLTEIFCSTDGEDMGNYSLGESSILRMPNYDEFSGVCFVSGTYLVSSLRESIAKTLQNCCTCPIVEIIQSDNTFAHIILDNNRAAAQLTEHMIATHRHKRVCYLGSDLEPQASKERFHHYKNVMMKYDLAVRETDYYFCDHTLKSIDAALSHFLSTDPKPDSIICYNDHISVLLMEALCRRNLRVPEDIAVAGFDNSEIGQNVTPALSTVTFPVYEMGQKAVEVLLDAIKRLPLPDCTIVTADPIYRGSCGCMTKTVSRPSFYENRLMEHIRTLEASMVNDIKMSAALNSVRELDEGMELLARFLPRIENCKEIYICLYQNWDSVPSHIREIAAAEEPNEDTDTLIMPFGYKDGKRVHRCSFTRKNILPDYVYKNSHSSYIYTPLFFEDREFGYMALAFKDNRLSYQFDYITWVANVSRMLKNICENKQNDLLVNCLEDIYMKDDLTGLYNRHGLRIMAKSLLKQAKENDETVLTMVFDLDSLKTINDHFGYPEGNFAITVLGQALAHAVTEKMITARLGGDEFYVLALGLTDENARDMIHSVNRYLDNYNRLHTKRYNIQVSSGYAFKRPEIISDIHELFDAADRSMYEAKASKNKNILKNV